ncbi:3-ketoacyl-CoA synthase 5-like [Aristolochia californica]|uniref:3-ketoacyl-CoA synthase 5-like n=1 Tax=Aristolochia californica TaxID=171875 RepID=UPI0035DC6F83
MHHSLQLKYFKLGCHYMMNHFVTLLLVPMTGLTLFEMAKLGPDGLIELWRFLNLDVAHVLLLSLLVAFMVALYFARRPRPVYLIEYACYKAPASFRFPTSKFISQTQQIENFDPANVEFQSKIIERSGLGDETSLPPALHHVPHSPTIKASREEAQLIIFNIVDDVLQKTGVQPKNIDILIVNCSLFSPTPSLTSMIINKYKMRSNIQSYNLSGMGCSAGLISIYLAKDLLQVNPNANALVVTTEIITQYWYTGNQRSMLLANCLFRMGGAAILLTNKSSERQRAKYRLLHVVRTHRGAEDKAYNSVYEEEDKQGNVGISLSKDLTTVAGEALKSNITTLGPLVLPLSEQLLFLFTVLGRKLINPKWKPYIPDFKQAFEHFCIHAGGRAVIDELAKKLDLSEEHVEPSRMTLHRFGNTSSSSPWYELSYLEAKGRMNKGDRAWQIALGSGFKCNSAVWKSLRNIKPPVDCAWSDCIDRYPIHNTDVNK